MLNLILVSTDPYPSEWAKKLNASVTHISQEQDVDSWARIIREHYREADALLTDLCPIWPPIGASDPYPIGFNGLNALNGAKKNDLHTFVYTPFTAPVIISECYRSGCSAVLSPYKHSLQKLSEVITECCTEDKVWIDETEDDALYNQLQCVTDPKLRDLSDTEIKTYLHIVMMEGYEQSAEALNLTLPTMRNYASKIFKGPPGGPERFPNRGAAITHALRIGIKGIH